MTGIAMNSPMIIATFMYVQKASVGVVKTSSVLRWRERKRITLVVKYSAMPRPTPAGIRLQMMRVRSSVRCSKNDILPASSSPGVPALAIGSIAHHHSAMKCRSWPTPRPASKPSRIARVT